MTRQTITIAQPIHLRINRLRGAFISERLENITFSEMIQALAALALPELEKMEQKELAERVGQILTEHHIHSTRGKGAE